MTTSTPTPTARSAETFRELADVAQFYFDLNYTCNLTLYDQLFHPLAQLFVLENGKVVSRTSAEFIDYLTLLRGEDGWRIVSKTYHRLSDD
jgi:hypothetical protein